MDFAPQTKTRQNAYSLVDRQNPCPSAWPWRDLAGPSPLKTTVSRHERLQHVRNKHGGVDRLAIHLRVQRGVTVEVGFQSGRAGKGQLRGFCFR